MISLSCASKCPRKKIHFVSEKVCILDFRRSDDDDDDVDDVDDGYGEHDEDRQNLQMDVICYVNS